VPAEPSQNSRPIVEPPPAKVAASRRKPIPASSTPKPQALSDESLPLIDLSAVASQLKDQRYRAHPALQPDADVVLPVLDARAIRENVKRRVAPRLAETALEAPLPVISPSEVEQNLQPLASRPRPVAATPTQPLPLINADEVRASLRQIHGARLKPRGASTPSAEVSRRLPPKSHPRAETGLPPSAPPSPLLSSSSALLRTQAVFVPAPVSPAPPISVAPPVAISGTVPVGPAPAAVLPPQVVPIISPIPVVPSVSGLAERVEPQPISIPEVPAYPVVSVEPEPVEDEAAELPRAPASAVPPAPDASSGLIWHSIQEHVSSEPEAMVLPASVPTPISTPRPAPRPAFDRSCLPSLDLLKPADLNQATCPEEVLLERGIVIEEKLAEFKVKVSVVDAYAGPVITRFEVEPAVGVRGSQVVNLIKDLARALGLASIRVVETIPGKTCMGLELPNPVRQMIRLSEILSSEEFNQPTPKLTLALGKDITGAPVVMDLARAPHLLVAGTTGSGKSVGVNAMILSLLYKFTPDDVRFIMIDPKMLELSVYNDIPHLLAPVVTDMKLAANALNWCVGEMEKRYRLMSALGVRNLAGYNEKVSVAAANGTPLKNPFSLTPEDPEPLAVLPAIVVVVDEFADLMMVAGKKIEELIARLAQKARAAGLHLILATQRPSVDVITGLIKANIPTRIAFQVSSKVDSRTILDQMGAEALLGQGDMLYLPPGSGYPQRIHGAFVDDDEVHSVVEVLKQFGEPDYVEGLLTGESELDEDAGSGSSASSGAEADPLYDEAVEIVLRTRKASISSVQRHLRIGYNRAARLIEEMEASGLVSSMENNGSRTVLVPQRDA